MSSHDHHSELSTPTVPSEPSSSNLIGCHHNHPAHIHPTQNRISSPQCEHNCNCVHQQNILPHHLHHHNVLNSYQSSQQGFNNQTHHEINSIENQNGLDINSGTSGITQQQQLNLGHPHHYMSVGNSTNVNLNIPTVSCDCGSNSNPPDQSERSSRVVSADENVPSGSEEYDKRRCPSRNKTNLEESRLVRPINRIDERKFTPRIEEYNDGTDSGVKVDDGTISEDDQGPPLPPRPPPRPRNVTTNESAPHSSGVRKYVIWCLICGGTSCLLGVMFLGVYFLLRSYTSTVGYFETVPTFVPATLLMLTGLCIMSLARRRNRYSYLIKLSGACGLASALTCALVTVTTTVLHMSRLQALRECEYTQKTRTCTCYSVMMDSQVEGVDEGVRFVFDSTADCGVVHGALYSCLRAVFGLSVAGVLVAVFSCMLVYQLLSHERKKMYWEQLELRCRSLYTGPPGNSAQVQGGPSIIGTPRGGQCRCCEQCHSHRNPMPTTYPWDGDNRFWTPGQAGNFYSPNPGGDELMGNSRCMPQSVQRSRGPGWSWPRMPWQRNEPQQQQAQQQQQQQQQRFRHQTPSSPDSQYGFSNTPINDGNPNQSQQGGYSVIGGPPYGIWGPPPPYSDPNSPARRGRYQYIHPSQCQPMMEQHLNQAQAVLECHQHSSSTDSHSMEQFCQQQQQTHRNIIKRQTGFKTKENYENTPSDSDGGPRDRFSNTLPVRKTKKRVEMGAKSIGPNQSAIRVNVQNVFSPIQNSEIIEHEYNNQGGEPGVSNSNSNNLVKSRRIKTGVENNGFQSIDQNEDGKIVEPTSESEVYFADVSSCCNMSVKNDSYYEDTNQRRLLKEKEKDENEDYLAQRFGKREASVRSRLPFPQMIPEDYEKPPLNIPSVAPRTSLLPKDMSRQSMCSVESGEKTDFTDLSPATPGSGFGPSYPIQENETTNFNNSYFVQNYNNTDFSEPTNSNFVASYPFSSNEQSVQEAHRRSTKNLQEVLLAPDAQYEIIKENNQFENIPLNLSYDQDINSYKNSHFKPKSPKNLNITPIKRQSLGTNISAIIQNLGGSDVGLLYPDNRRESDIESSQDCSSKNNKSISENDWSDHSDRRL